MTWPCAVCYPDRLGSVKPIFEYTFQCVSVLVPKTLSHHLRYYRGNPLLVGGERDSRTVFLQLC